MTRDNFLDSLDRAGLCEDALYEDYSGRGMYGAKCVGLTGSAADFAMFAAALSEELGFETARDILARLASDSMGLEMIFYFPGVNFEEVTA